MSNITYLWSAARVMFSQMWYALGPAAALAQRHWLAPEEKREIIAWLAPIEALVRHLLLIEAKLTPALPTPIRKPKALAPKPRATERPPSFRVWTKPKPHPARIRSLAPHILVRDIFKERARLAAARRLAACRYLRRPLAERLARRTDALWRVLEKPAAAIRRLARKLQSEPKLAARMLTRRSPRSSHHNENARDEAIKRGWALTRAPDSS